MPQTWRDTRNENERLRRLASAYRRMALVEAAMARELADSERVSPRTLVRADLARSRLRVLGESVEGL